MNASRRGRFRIRHGVSLLVLILAQSMNGQAPDFPFRPDGGLGGPGRFDGPPPFDGPGFGPGGPGGPNQPPLQVLRQFDRNGDNMLDANERKAAREFVQRERANGRGMRGPGGRRMSGPGFRSDDQELPRRGPRVSPSDVKATGSTNLFDLQIVRTIFLEFEQADWEKELTTFVNTDVDVPAKVTVDGRTYDGVGVHFRGASSYFTVGEGFKHSLNLSFDFIHEKQSLLGYRTVNLLNSHEDPSFLRTVLYSEIARRYLPTPRANFVKVVINGESWGVYINAQQFNKDFTRDQFGTTKGARWKVPGSPRGRGGLEYLGGDPADYRTIYTIKSKDDADSWKDLVRLCRVLNETSPDKLEAALAPVLDIDGVLRFLALENALINNDGYWVRSSDYNLYEDEMGRFHLVPHDLNETFSLPGGPGFGRRFGGGPGGGFGPGGVGVSGRDFGPENRPDLGGPPGGPMRGPRVDGVKLDPLTGANDAGKPLLSKLLAVPALRQRYLGFVREIATRWLDWKNLGPLVTRYHELIAADVAADTRKLDSTQAFNESVTGGNQAVGTGGFRPGRGRPTIGLKPFAEQRRAYLLERLAEFPQ